MAEGQEKPHFGLACRKIVGIARSYAKHAEELNNPVPKEPAVFLKAPSSVILEGSSVRIPAECKDCAHEVELGVVIGTRATCVSADAALNHVQGYFLALDMTARDIQTTLKNSGLSWAIAKGFDTFCPVSNLIDKELIEDTQNLELWLKVDEEERQRCSTGLMIWSVAELISFVSHKMTLEPGDLILTGTPHGVGPVKAGQRVTCGITGVAEMSFPVENAA